jgi:transcription elongation factor Elf1
VKPVRCPECETRIVHLIKEDTEKGVATFICVGCDIDFEVNYQRDYKK